MPGIRISEDDPSISERISFMLSRAGYIPFKNKTDSDGISEPVRS